MATAAVGPVDYVVALLGNPNVGKSTVFNRLTRSHAETANYPGKTVEVAIGLARTGGRRVALVDLPGTYSLHPTSEDQRIVRDFLSQEDLAAVIVVVDASNLARNLYLVLEVLDLGLPVVIAANLVDEAERRGLFLDAHRLAERLDVPVVPTVATRGQGLDGLLPEAIRAAKQGPLERPWYGDRIEAAVAAAEADLPPDDVPSRLSRRGAVLLHLGEGTSVESSGSNELAEALPRARHALAADIAGESIRRREADTPPADRIWHWITSPTWGMAILVGTLLGIFLFVYGLGGFLATAFADGWAAYVSPPLDAALRAVAGDTVIARILIWGLDAGIGAALAVGIPYVFAFYLVLAFLEDSGYLNAAAFLSDRVMHRFGLHGRAVIPIVAGLGCNVPAIMGTRVLGTRRERLIAATLVTLVPCSARSAVIFGAVGFYLGIVPALLVYGIQLGVVVLAGIFLNRIVPGRSTGLVMEVFPLRRPRASDLLRKTWWRFRSYVTMALPIVVVGSAILGALFETGTVWALSAPLAVVVTGWLGLPAVAGLALLFAVLRKELALQLLVALGTIVYGSRAAVLTSFLSPIQLVVFAVVATIYVPCVATVAALARELGWRASLEISAFTIALALAVGGIALRVLPIP